MPHRYYDWWWDDLPPGAIKCAEDMGFDKKIWDGDEKVHYDTADFKDLSQKEKEAALLLGCELKIEHVYWPDLDDDTKKALEKAGYDQHKWDHDWEWPCFEKYWKDMTPEEKEGLNFLGWTQHSWDEDGGWPEESAEESESESESEEEEVAQQLAEASVADSEPEEAAEETTAVAAEDPAQPPPESSSPMYGGKGGKEFDHGHNKRIVALTIRSGLRGIVGVIASYSGGKEFKCGGKLSASHDEFVMGDGEYITKATVNAGRVVQNLTFETNLGRTLGPCGNKSSEKSKISVVKAPPGGALLGLKGLAGRKMYAIGFNWGPAPTE